VPRDDLDLGEDEKPDVAAAGGVLLRREDGAIRVAVIHRPKYMDWSLPKGKLEKGEDWLEAALREVEEETGYRCEAGPELPRVSYLDRKGRRKLVRYWLMDVEEGGFKPHGEVDELRWVTRDEADELLSYPHDQKLVGKAIRRFRWRRLLGRR
jgi:8-oxo-dGTP diphosphatase